jgi:hypothetical protein
MAVVMQAQGCGGQVGFLMADPGVVLLRNLGEEQMVETEELHHRESDLAKGTAGLM